MRWLYRAGSVAISFFKARYQEWLLLGWLYRGGSVAILLGVVLMIGSGRAAPFGEVMAGFGLCITGGLCLVAGAIVQLADAVLATAAQAIDAKTEKPVADAEVG